MEAAPPARPVENTLNIASFLWSICKTWMIAGEQYTHQQITVYELHLDEMMSALYAHDLCAREIHSTDVVSWQAKYNAWVIRQHVLIQIEKVTPQYLVSAP
jgi:hypothetical protein